jgi:hypothetical protein
MVKYHKYKGQFMVTIETGASVTGTLTNESQAMDAMMICGDPVKLG